MLKKFKSKANAKQKMSDMIQRGIIIAIYVIISTIIVFALQVSDFSFLAFVFETFFYAHLNAYYCFEYKTAANDVLIK